MIENWRPVVGYEGLYEVSDQGRVRNAAGQILRAVGRYPHVTLCGRVPRRLNANVHTLVAEAFIGPRPDGQEVRHFDDVKTNNALTNLSYGTKSDNGHDMVRNGRHRNARKTHCPQNHEYTEANTYITPGSGIRDCRACSRMEARERSRRSNA